MRKVGNPFKWYLLLRVFWHVYSIRSRIVILWQKHWSWCSNSQSNSLTWNSITSSIFLRTINILEKYATRCNHLLQFPSRYHKIESVKRVISRTREGKFCVLYPLQFQTHLKSVFRLYRDPSVTNTRAQSRRFLSTWWQNQFKLVL